MKCIHCSQEIPENNKFCPFCGKQQASECPSCGKESAPGTAFCVHCGARLSTSSPAAGAGTISSTSSALIQQTPASSQVIGGPPPDNSSGSGQTLFYQPQSAAVSQPNQMGGFPSNLQVDAAVGVGRRFLAIIIDTIILYVINYFITKAFGGTAATDMTGGMSTNFALQGPAALIVMIVDLAYFVVLEGMMGATLGKLVFGMRVIMADGSKATMGASLIRNLLRIVDGIPFIIPYLLGAILVWTSPAKQRVGDRAAKTMVVRASALK